MTVVVVDASVVVLWFVEQDFWPEARRIAARADGLAAPDFLKVEVANVLWKLVRRGALTDETANAAFASLDAPGMEFVPTAPLIPRARELARALDHPIYDSLYLAAAEAMRTTVITADRRFRDAVAGGEHAGRVRWIGDMEG